MLKLQIDRRKTPAETQSRQKHEYNYELVWRGKTRRLNRPFETVGHVTKKCDQQFPNFLLQL